jgi:succinyl-diaminopimelate desuccinylase
MDVDIRYLPNQDPDEILAQVRTIDDISIRRTFVFPPAYVSRSNPFVVELCDVVLAGAGGESVSVGRDGASDAVSFLKAGIPAVEFGPAGAGHHGPEEWVSIASLGRYRQILVDFARRMAAPRLEAVEGTQAA